MTNNQPKTTCPSHENLVAYCSGRLGMASSASISEHVAECVSCESALNELPDFSISAIFCAADRFDDLFADPCIEELRTHARRSWPPDDSSAPASFDSTRSLAERDQLLVKKFAPSDPNTPEPTAPSLPEKIGKYFVIKKLGRGGFATVYLAKDPENNRLVAMKVPRDDSLTTETQIEEFLREARTAAELKHRAIVQVYDWGRHNGSCFVVMQYVEGRTLKDLLQSERLGLNDAVSLTAQIARALEFAHQAGVYHRDVKPANILIDDDFRPYIADFGLAIRDAERWSHCNEVAGTYAYMSPEQVRGEAQFFDGRTDIWSLGVVFYEVLTGERPFQGRDRAELFAEIRSRTPRPLRQFKRVVPKWLDTIVAMSLAKNPHERFSTAGDMAKALERRVFPRGRMVLAGTAFLAVALLALLVLMHLVTSSYKSIPSPSAGWVQLLDAPPRKLVWPRVTDTSRILPGRNPGEITLDTEAFVLADCYETDSTDFRFRVSIQRNAWLGTVGIFWGFQMTAEDPPTATCQALFVTSSMSDGERNHWLRREALSIRFIDGAHFFDKQPLADSFKVAGLGFQDCELEVRVENGRLELVKWNGEEVACLADPIPTTDHFAVPECRGKMGLLNYSGSSCFKDARFQLLTENFDER